MADSFIDIISYVALGLFALTLIIIAVGDVRSRRVPNLGIIALVGVWVFWRAVLVYSLCSSSVPFLDALATPDGVIGVSVFDGIVASASFGVGSLVLAVVFERVRGEFAMGGGDIKLLFAIGLYLGLQGETTAVFIACAFSVVVALLFRKLSENIPFGLSLAIGSVASMVYTLFF